MTAEQYARWSAPLRTPGRSRALNLTNLLLTRLCYLCYPLLLLRLGMTGDPRLGAALAVPAVSFLLVTVFRKKYNAPRPYELLEIQPIIQKDKPGQSFPSRHVFSMVIIAMTFLWILPPAGVILLVFSLVLALCRVLGGVHFPRDVIAGTLFGAAAGLVGYWLIF